MSLSYYRLRETTFSDGPRRGNYFRPRFRRQRRPTYPWYTNPRNRPTLYERDRRFRDWLRERLKERERIHRDEGGDSDTDEETEEKPEVPSTVLSTKLRVTNINFNIPENTRKHHTDMYECTEDRYRESDRSNHDAQLVVRRGQPFLMTINFDRPYNKATNDLKLTFTMASEGSSKVKESFSVTESKNKSYRPRKWGASLEKKDGKSLLLEVFCPPSTPVGEWEVSVKTIVDVKDGKDLIWQYQHNDELVILFNPWCKEDTVYLSDETWLNEAVLNDHGAYYFGNYRQIGGQSWYYGQFEDGILDIALHLLRRGFEFTPSQAMGYSARVARVLSKIVNAQDDDGVLVGNWSDDYSGGLPPTSWTGSVKILKQYMRTGKPVKYGQCWVFSHVLTSVCRALGLPCRSLTNFASAHNTDKDHLSHDTVFIKKPDGELFEMPSSDSIWNFHVWNEVWMSRPDLGREYDGWQAIDATPQESSDGVYCCGPAPVTAIKEGVINVGQDTAFVFAEVNADKIQWLMDPETGDKKVLARNKHAIGKKVSTHHPTGGPDTRRMDITSLYKYDEGSKQERSAVKKAEGMFRQDNLPPEDEEEPPKMPIQLEIEEKDDIYLGSPFDVEVVAVNENDSPRTVNLRIKVQYKTYFGNVTGRVAGKRFKGEKLAAGERRTFKVHVPARDALRRPKEGFNFQITAIANVEETDNIVSELADFRLRRQDIVVKGPSVGKAGEHMNVEVSYTNPLDSMMTNVEIEIDGNIKTITDHIRVSSIRAGETWKTTLKMTPSKKPTSSKERNAGFSLESDQLSGIIGTYTLTLK